MKDLIDTMLTAVVMIFLVLYLVMSAFNIIETKELANEKLAIEYTIITSDESQSESVMDFNKTLSSYKTQNKTVLFGWSINDDVDNLSFIDMTNVKSGNPQIITNP